MKTPYLNYTKASDKFLSSRKLNFVDSNFGKRH